MSKKTKKTLTSRATETRVAVPPAAAEIIAPGSSRETTDLSETAGGANLPPDVVVWPEKTTGSQTLIEVRPAASSATLEQRAAAEAKVPQIVNQEPARRGGAGWFIPPQKPSGFGVKKG